MRAIHVATSLAAASLVAASAALAGPAVATRYTVPER
jgi:hypothetical protein